MGKQKKPTKGQSISDAKAARRATSAASSAATAGTSMSALFASAARGSANAIAPYVVSAFDRPRCDLFAAVTVALGAHQLSVWDTRTGVLVATLKPPSPSTRLTSLAWCQDPSLPSDAPDDTGVNGEDANSSLKRRRASGGGGSGKPMPPSRLIAAGTMGGEILIFSVARAVLVTTLTAPASSKSSSVSSSLAPTAITGICVSAANRRHAFSVAASGDVVHWDIASKTVLARFNADSQLASRVALYEAAAAGGSGAAAAAAAASSPAKLMVAGHQVRLYQAPDEKASTPARVLKEFVGHASQVLAVKFSRSGSLCLSAAAQDRFISVWDCDASSNKPNVAALTVDTPPVDLDVSPADRVLVLDEAGVVCLWNSAAPSSTRPNDPDAASGKKARPSATPTRKPEAVIKLSLVPHRKATNDAELTADAASSARPAPILAVSFCYDDRVMVAYGNSLVPKFERVTVLSPSGNLLPSIPLLRSADSPLASAKAMNGNLVAGAKQYGETRDSTVISGQFTVHEEESHGAGDVDEAEVENLTIAERLSQMAQSDMDAPLRSAPHAAGTLPAAGPTRFQPSIGANGTTAGRAAGAGNAMGVGGTTAAAGSALRPSRRAGRADDRPSATTLHTVVSQAIHSADRELLERSLAVREAAVIGATVARLPPSQVVPFVEMLLAILQSKPARASMLVPWIRAALVGHAPFIMANPHLARSLAALYQVLDARVATYQKLLRLSGRLDLVMAQMSLRGRASTASDEAADGAGAVAVPETVYDERDDDDEDDEDDDEKEDLEDEDEDDDENAGGEKDSAGSSDDDDDEFDDDDDDDEDDDDEGMDED